MLRSEFDAHGYDLVMARGPIVRHIQFKTGKSAKPGEVSISMALADKPSGCAPWICVFEMAGVELDGHGYIKVNERLETSAPEVWAIGECAGSPQFTHVSFDDFRIIRDNLAETARPGTG